MKGCGFLVPMPRSHTGFVERLEERVGSRYVTCQKEVSFAGNGASGDIDLVGIREDGLYDIYEVKCSPERAKARMQLRKIEDVLRSQGIVVHGKFLYCGDSDTLFRYHRRIERSPGESSFHEV